MSLIGAYDPDNVFARILRGDLPCVKVWETDRVLAFMDVFPQSEGHVLVISKASRAQNLLEVEPEVMAELAEGVRRTARAAAKALSPDGV
jgi:histidine triad (HIT) family protein